MTRSSNITSMGGLSNVNMDLIEFDPIQTIPELFSKRVARDPDTIAYSEFIEGRWTNFTWQEVSEKVRKIRAALDQAGMERGDRVGILLPNCTDWIAFDIAALANGLISVPIYPHDGTANICYILKNSGARLCIIETQEIWLSLMQDCAQCSKLETIWVRQASFTPHHATSCRIEPFHDALSNGEIVNDQIRCGAENVATIIYTSGTTGLPKGVMLSHRALLWNADAVTKFTPPLTTDVFLSVLPLAHSFERTMGFLLPLVGGAQVTFSRSIELLRDDIGITRPTILIAVPRLYERIYEAIMIKAGASPVTKLLTVTAADIGWRIFEAEHNRGAVPGFLTRTLLWPILRRLVAKKVMTAFGGRLRVAVSGGAPLSQEASHFLIGLGLPLLEGYGLTETAPVVTATSFKDNLPGSVGSALYGVDLKITEYGELLVRSPSMMIGYWQDPEKTKQAFDSVGWFRTGDIAEFREDHVFIKGRVKEIIALSTGKKIAPTSVESLICNEPLFEQALVTGDGKSCLVAIVVLNQEVWTIFANQLGIAENHINAEKAEKAILQKIACATEGLPCYSRIRAVYAVLEPWTTENGLLTPTLKIKREAIEKHFKDKIGAMFSQLKTVRRN